jgi:hypothetical protein
MLKQVKRTSGAINQRRQELDHKIQGLFARIHVGGRISMQIHGNPGALKQNGSTEPWIFDPTAVATVDRTVDTVHRSTVDQAKGYPSDLIRTVRGRSHGPGREHATRGGGLAGTGRG